MSLDKASLLGLSADLDDDSTYEEPQGAPSIQIRDGQTMDPYLEDSEGNEPTLPVEAEVSIRPSMLDRNQEIRSKPALLRTTSNSTEDVRVQRMPVAFSSPLLHSRGLEENDPKTVAALSRYKYYKHLEKHSASNKGNPAAEPVLLMPEHMLPAQFLTILSFSKKITGKQKSIITIFALWNTMMGTALLSMPWAIKMAGFATGILLLKFIAFLMFYSAYRIITCTKAMEHLGILDFSDVCRHYLGQFGYIISNICSLISLMGGMIVYWILLTNFMYNTVKYIFLESNDQFKNGTENSSGVLCPNRKNHTGNNSTYFSLSVDPMEHKIEEFNKIWQLTKTVPLFLLIILFPLLNFKSPTFFTKFNSLASVSVAYLIIFTIVKGFQWGINIEFTDPTGLYYSPNFSKMFPALTGIAALAYFIHNCIIAIIQHQEKPENDGRDLGIAFFLVCLTYLIVGVGLYITFPDAKDCISDNILDNLPLNDILAVIARLFIFLQLGAIFPLLIYVFRIQLMHVAFKVIWPGLHWVILMNLFVCGLCIIFACFFPLIGKVIGFVGAFCGFSYALALPMTVYLMSCHESGTLTWLKLVFHVFLIILGLANFVAQFLL